MPQITLSPLLAAIHLSNRSRSASARCCACCWRAPPTARSPVASSLSVNTVKRHVYNLCGKLGVQSRTQAIIRARALNLL